MPTPGELQLVERWRSLLTSYNDVSTALDRELQARHDIGLSEFEALERLIETGEKCLMKALGTGMYLSQSALSRTVARLEREGLVERTMCADDRRSVYVTPTSAGRARYEQARSTHRAVLADHLG
jgi:DNA-binding MarR family transcriptional regulator